MLLKDLLEDYFNANRPIGSPGGQSGNMTFADARDKIMNSEPQHPAKNVGGFGSYKKNKRNKKKKKKKKKKSKGKRNGTISKH